MRRLFCGFVVSLLTATTMAHAEGLTNVFSFTEETKVKGPFMQIGGELYFTCEKGGTYAYGYIAKFCPTNRMLTVLYEFQTETKPKGLSIMSNDLWFVTEKGGTNNYGYVGRFSMTSNTVERICDFASLISAKSAPFTLGTNGFYFFTEAGGSNGLGALMHYSLTGGLSTAASFTTALGTKTETRPVYLGGSLYYGARAGGDTTQQSGLGSGSIGTIDLASGTITKLIDLNATNHGSRVKALLPFNGRIYYTTDEGGDLTLNGGKGSGAAGYFDPTSNTLTRLFVCNGTTTGVKPKGLVAVEDHIYFNCGEGAANGCGSWYVITNGTNVSLAALNDIPFGNKSDMLTLYGTRIYCSTEQGCSNWLGGISSYEVDVDSPQLLIGLRNGQTCLDWPALANDFVLETCPSLAMTNGWTPSAGPGITNAVVPVDSSCGFFRLRRPPQ